MSGLPDTPPSGCWPCRRRQPEKIKLPPIAGAIGKGTKAKPPFLPQPPKSQQSDLLLKKLEKQSTHPSRKLKKAGITVASETLAAKSAGLQWGLVQQGSSNLSLPVLERPESRFSSTGRLSRIDTVNDRLALAQRIRQKEIKANHVRQREMQKKLDKAHETIEKGFENRERKYTNTLSSANLAPSATQKNTQGGFSYSLDDTRPSTPAARPSLNPIPSGSVRLKALDLEEEREAYRAQLREKQEKVEAARQKKLKKKIEKARESSINGEKSRERRTTQQHQKSQKVKSSATARLSTAQDRRHILLSDRQDQARQEVEKALRMAERKRELDIHHHQVQADLALRNPENIDALASRDEILEVVHSDFWDQ